MGLFNKKQAEKVTGNVAPVEKGTPDCTPISGSPIIRSRTTSVHEQDASLTDALKKQPATPMAIILGSIAAIGGFMFGYESGQISGKPSLPDLPSTNLQFFPGFLQMSDFLELFGEDGKFSAARAGTIVGLLCI